MFDTPAQAHQIIEERFAPDMVGLVASALRPAIVFSSKVDDRLGGSRIGGTPDLPSGMEWPRRPVPDDVDGIAQRAGEPFDADLRQHLGAGLPYAFVAQVDLGEAARLGDFSQLLPDAGRLLFFYDMVAGPFDTGVQSAKVIWDRSSVDALAHAPMPDSLMTAASGYRAMIDDVNRQYGIQSDVRPVGAPTPGTPYGGPSRAMAPKMALQLPSFSSIEFQASGQLVTTYSADRGVIGGAQAFSQAYDELSVNAAPEALLIGAPVPEQDDPRYDAVVVSHFNVQSLSRTDWEKNRDMVMERAKDWKLLLQISVPGWMQDSGEGTVYFLIRAKDLQDRAFERVIAVYQQT
ncbi:DUF1963 domain-containing protein [Agrobacterium larrymoorei]|uniref:DUF1963 domain-containing protein n=1 Tax=Agrobacterium larrymoorei TaxID=160699 RepID=A0ABX8T7M0_9HYPH|nr:DUF1963 domain-containing protein [Agrobacterium larrymoorei]QYA08715.1 DUF1963 domain-containing protein [Agrobacterium larrymoorei]